MHETVAYHAPCQQQGHWIGKPAMELLALIPGLDVREMDARLLRHRGHLRPQAARSTRSAWTSAADLFGQVDGGGAGVVACDSETCRWQIEHATGVRPMHPVELLHQAYGLG